MLTEKVAAEKSLITTPKDKPAPAPMEGDDSRPLVYHIGKLPSGLPDWFAKLDVDHDGQVGLYEWKRGGRLAAEFVLMDQNSDGFITCEEVLHYLSKRDAKYPDAQIPPRSNCRTKGDEQGPLSRALQTMPIRIDYQVRHPRPR